MRRGSGRPASPRPRRCHSCALRVPFWSRSPSLPRPQSGQWRGDAPPRHVAAAANGAGRKQEHGAEKAVCKRTAGRFPTSQRLWKWGRPLQATVHPGQATVHPGRVQRPRACWVGRDRVRSRRLGSAWPRPGSAACQSLSLSYPSIHHLSCDLGIICRLSVIYLPIYLCFLDAEAALSPQGLSTTTILQF